MNDLLKNLIEKPKPKPPKGILYGPPGVGKTTFGASAPNAIIIDCENGCSQTTCARTPYLQTWPEVESYLQAIETEKHDKKVMIIDTIDWLMILLRNHVSGASGGDYSQTLNKSHGGYGNGKQVLKNHIYNGLLPQLDRIVNKGIAVVLLAHVNRQDITDVDGITIEKTVPDLPDEYRNIFVEWSDFVCVANKRDDESRYLLTTESNKILAKNRYGLPPELPFNWASFSGAISESMSKVFNNPQNKESK